MSRICLGLAALSVFGMCVGCAYPRSPIGPYTLYADVHDALLVNPGDIPDNLKEGTAEATSIVGVTLGDSSIDKARKSVGIKKIHYVDYHSWGILGVYSKTTTKVYGE
jgi:hypothetical protein